MGYRDGYEEPGIEEKEGRRGVRGGGYKEGNNIHPLRAFHRKLQKCHHCAYAIVDE